MLRRVSLMACKGVNTDMLLYHANDCKFQVFGCKTCQCVEENCDIFLILIIDLGLTLDHPVEDVIHCSEMHQKPDM